MMALGRQDTSIVGRWWWGVDRLMLAAILGLAAVGTLLGFAAGPSVATRIGLDPYHFVVRQGIFLIPALGALVLVSMLGARDIRRLGVALYAVGMVMMVATLTVGPEIKGATRWLYIAGFSVQPSEFVKPAFAVVAAWMFAMAKRQPGFPGTGIAIALFMVTAATLLMQPDVGMTVVVTAVWGAQFFLAGLPIGWIVGLAGLGIVGAVGAYMLLPHVAKRVDSFLDPGSADTYQIDRALEAFRAGGVMGTGPGDGTVKLSLPDAHTDFVFAVAGEEFGLILCLAVVGLYALIVLRGMGQLLRSKDLFVLLAAGGLLTQFGLQALINMAVNLHLLPTKGMTLPFISYGGSSLLALALGMGMALALLRAARDPEVANWTGGDR